MKKKKLKLEKKRVRRLDLRTAVRAGGLLRPPTRDIIIIDHMR
jgi:hypothetical protein